MHRHAVKVRPLYGGLDKNRVGNQFCLTFADVTIKKVTHHEPRMGRIWIKLPD
jgi:hypothetical protein